MTPAEFSALVAEVEHDVSLGYSPDIPLDTIRALLEALRETRAALVESFDILRGVEMSKASLESALTKARAALTAYPLDEQNKGE